MTGRTHIKKIRVLTALIAAIGSALPLFAAKPADGAHDFHKLDVLGTSLDMTIVAQDQQQAQQASEIIYAEIERLRKILSSHDEDSELAKINASTEAVKVSQELIEVMQDYDTWAGKTKGAVSGQLGKLIELWKTAETAGKVPDTIKLLSAAQEIRQSAWRIDQQASTVTRVSAQQINLDALGKSYIVDKVIEVVRAKMPEIKGILLNIGGDIKTWGSASLAGATAWQINVADPQHPQQNAKPLATTQFRNMAIVTSGSYERFYTINGRKYSHILDPRNGQPAQNVISATVIATDTPMANALATALCVLPPAEGIRLINTTDGAECLIVTSNGGKLRSAGFARYEKANEPGVSGKNTFWPDGYELTLNMTVKPHPNKPKLRPYVAAWVEDSNGRMLRTIELWANKRKLKYLKDMTGWWRFGRNQKQTEPFVTRATRQAGQYSVTWDGLDAQGNPVSPGQYKIVVEVCYEDGDDTTRSTKIECGSHEARATIADTTTFEKLTIRYGKAEN